MKRGYIFLVLLFASFLLLFPGIFGGTEVCTTAGDENNNGECDYDSSVCSHGDVVCPVSITGISVSSSTPTPGSSITVDCTSSVANLNSIGAGIDGGGSCAWQSWVGNAARFSCNVGTSTGSKTITCSVMTAHSYKWGTDRTATINVQSSSNPLTISFTRNPSGSSSVPYKAGDYVTANFVITPSSPLPAWQRDWTFKSSRTDTVIGSTTADADFLASWTDIYAQGWCSTNGVCSVGGTWQASQFNCGGVNVNNLRKVSETVTINGYTSNINTYYFRCSDAASCKSNSVACSSNSECCSGYCSGTCKVLSGGTATYAITNKKSVYSIGDTITDIWSLPSYAYDSRAPCNVWFYVNGVPDNVGWDGYVTCGDSGLNANGNTGTLTTAHCYGKTSVTTNTVQIIIKNSVGATIIQSGSDSYTINCAPSSCKSNSVACSSNSECCSGYCSGTCKALSGGTATYTFTNKKSVYNVGDTITSVWSLPYYAYEDAPCTVHFVTTGSGIYDDFNVTCGDPGLDANGDVGTLTTAHCFGKTSTIANSVQIIIKGSSGNTIVQSGFDSYTINCAPSTGTTTISGYVRDGSSGGISGVTVTAAYYCAIGPSLPSVTATTSSSGYYSMVVDWGSCKDANVYVSKSGCTFTPFSQLLTNMGSSVSQNFVGACSAQGCTDSDGGIVYDVAGIAVGLQGWGNGGYYTWPDYCNDANYLYEFFCVNTTTLNYDYHLCPGGCSLDKCNSVATCPNGACAVGENCPVDNVSCANNKCYNPTCTNGCGQVAVPNGLTDEACYDSVGCTGGSCVCSGTGSCVSSSNTLPQGTFDVADSTQLAGWAADADAPTTPLQVQLYDGSTLLGSVTANLDRSDVCNAIGAQYKVGNTCPHGFSVATYASLKDGNTHTIHAYAVNTPVGNNPELAGSPKTLTVTPSCTLSSVSITPNCAGGATTSCDPGEIVSMSGSYSGSCSAANFFQVDASDSANVCSVQYTGGDVSGISKSSPTLSSGTVSGTWVVPSSIPSDCSGKTVVAKAAALWQGFPGAGAQVAFTNSPSGSFIFAGAVATCPNGACAVGENCPVDNVSCANNKCYDPACTNGCGQVAVPNGLTDEACYDSVGCTGGSCVCDGAGACVSSAPVCTLDSASITAYCAVNGPTLNCDPGDPVIMAGSYSGSCSAANFFQVDASDSANVCSVQYTGGDVYGISKSSPTLSLGTVSGTWVVPSSIPSDCSGKTVVAKAAALWQGFPGVGAQLGSTTSVSGSFVFVGACNPEICNNGIDDDCNGLVDCADSVCSSACPACPVGTQRCPDGTCKEHCVIVGDTHTLCQNNTCAVVQGPGVSQCLPVGGTCNAYPQNHSDCIDGLCGLVVGSGGNVCFNNNNCNDPPSHTECRNGVCVEVLGAGVSECLPVGGSCTLPPVNHTGCLNAICALFAGGGIDTCFNNIICVGDFKHNECMGGLCVEVAGPGANQCTVTAGCNEESHTECIGNSCVLVQGAGVSQCLPFGSICSLPPQSHAECVDGMCVLVAGAGTDECADDNQCNDPPAHTECQANQCVVVNGSGVSQCLAVNSACSIIPPETHSECIAGNCVSVDGSGSNLCSVNDDCKGIECEIDADCPPTFACGVNGKCGCPAGTDLCSDGTCSNSCDSSVCDVDGLCEYGESCACVDCNDGDSASCDISSACLGGVCVGCVLSNPKWVDVNCGIDDSGEVCVPMQGDGGQEFAGLAAFGSDSCKARIFDYGIFLYDDSDEEIIDYSGPAIFEDGNATSFWDAFWIDVSTFGWLLGAEDPVYTFHVTSPGLDVLYSTNTLKVCKDDGDCDGVGDDKPDLCENSPYLSPVNADGCTGEQEVCINSIDCSAVQWSECDANNRKSRNICKDSDTNPNTCCDIQDTCMCNLGTCLGHSNWIPTSRKCLIEEDFPFFSAANVLVVLSILLCYYFFVQVKRRR